MRKKKYCFFSPSKLTWFSSQPTSWIGDETEKREKFQPVRLWHIHRFQMTPLHLQGGREQKGLGSTPSCLLPSAPPVSCLCLSSQVMGVRALCWPSLENSTLSLFSGLGWPEGLSRRLTPYFHLLWCHSSFSLRSEGSCDSQLKALQSRLTSALWHHLLLTSLKRQAGTPRSLLCHVRAKEGSGWLSTLTA